MSTRRSPAGSPLASHICAPDPEPSLRDPHQCFCSGPSSSIGPVIFNRAPTSTVPGNEAGKSAHPAQAPRPQAPCRHATSATHASGDRLFQQCAPLWRPSPMALRTQQNGHLAHFAHTANNLTVSSETAAAPLSEGYTGLAASHVSLPQPPRLAEFRRQKASQVKEPRAAKPTPGSLRNHEKSALVRDCASGIKVRALVCWWKRLWLGPFSPRRKRP
jgi:hypothetical protein